MTAIETRDKVDWKANLVLVSNDKKEFELSKEKAAAASKFISDLVDAADEDEELVLPLDYAAGKELELVCSHIVHHHGNPMKKVLKPLRGTLDTVLEDWDLQFVQKLMKGEDIKELIKVSVAANKLQVSMLVELTAVAIASVIAGKSTAEMREILGLEKGYSDEEEERIRNDGPWPGIDDVEESK